jgi:hypothetical protein
MYRETEGETETSMTLEENQYQDQSQCNTTQNSLSITNCLSSMYIGNDKKGTAVERRGSNRGVTFSDSPPSSSSTRRGSSSKSSKEHSSGPFKEHSSGKVHKEASSAESSSPSEHYVEEAEDQSIVLPSKLNKVIMLRIIFLYIFKFLHAEYVYVYVYALN